MDGAWVIAFTIVITFVLVPAGLWMLSTLFGERCWRCRSCASVRLNRLRALRPVAAIYLCRVCGHRNVKLFRR
jgi:hypothetical protein